MIRCGLGLLPLLLVAGMTAGAAEEQTAPGKAVSSSRPAVHAPASTAGAQPVADLEDLKRRLAGTNAVGVFTKLALKRNAENLQGEFRSYHAGGASVSLQQLRERYDVLVQEVVLMLQQRDPDLARDVAAAREHLWSLLSDREKFVAL